MNSLIQFMLSGVKLNYILKEGLVAYYKFDEAVGFVVSDAHNSNDGLGTNIIYGVTGKINTAYSFAGLNNFVSTPLVSTSNFTKGAWIYVSADVSGNIIGKYDGTSKIEQLYYNKDLNNVKFDFGQVGGSRVIISTPTNSINLNQWYFIAVTYDGITIKLYQDSILQDSSITVPSDYIDTRTFDIGRRSDGGSYFTGKLDEVFIKNIAMPQSQLTEVYNSGNGLPYNSWT